MIHQQCVYNYYKNSKSKIAFSIYRTLLHTASGLGKHLDEYNQFENKLDNAFNMVANPAGVIRDPETGERTNDVRQYYTSVSYTHLTLPTILLV